MLVNLDPGRSNNINFQDFIMSKSLWAYNIFFYFEVLIFDQNIIFFESHFLFNVVGKYFFLSWSHPLLIFCSWFLNLSIYIFDL